MKIIRNGYIVKRFKCGWCGCVFEACANEYEEVKESGCRKYIATCPQCGDEVQYIQKDDKEKL